jgi:hypothetical protein
LPRRLDFYGKETRYKAIESIAGKRPVIFTGSFQNPSNYHFFTGKEATVLSAVNSRRTQFDILQKELDYQGKPAFVCGVIPGKSQEYRIGETSIHAFATQSFQSVNRLTIDYTILNSKTTVGDTLYIEFELSNPTEFNVDFRHPDFPVSWKAVYHIGTKTFEFRDCIVAPEIIELAPFAKTRGVLTTLIPDLTVDECHFALSLDNTVCYAQNSMFTVLILKR